MFNSGSHRSKRAAVDLDVVNGVARSSDRGVAHHSAAIDYLNTTDAQTTSSDVDVLVERPGVGRVDPLDFVVACTFEGDATTVGR